MRAPKALSLTGLAEKAGKVKSGEFAAEKSIKTGRAFLVIAAGDASDNTRKKFSNSCTYYHIPFRVYSDKENLGHAIGKQDRAVLAVEDPGLAKAILAELDREGS